MEVKLCAHSHLEQCRRCSARPRRFAELIMAMCLENGYGYGSIPKWYNFLGDERGWIYKIPMMGMGQNLSIAYFGWTNIHKSHELMWTTGVLLVLTHCHIEVLRHRFKKTSKSSQICGSSMDRCAGPRNFDRCSGGLLWLLWRGAIQWRASRQVGQAQADGFDSRPMGSNDIQ